MKSITIDELRAGRDIPLIDVREDHEYAAGRVPGAISIPMSQLGERIDELPDGAFDVICQAGGRSAQVVAALEARGYDATNVTGGTGEWAARGFELER
ncbi:MULTISPECIES: rhodanese-like domain-containing protein [Microbacterium]|jgi:rhodanese-related sulfurtransferase|uniref:rhodanese-like domain-containing protein n=1 Tax=Microbacterium TaxID=33882 RepID=UPI000E756C31|nr:MULTISPECIES: rhodanese-like domain-containing protein [Microbacterium]MDF2580357.1 sulfurtransferase [Microbacterium sp.]RKE63956.1 rhodanese-related sulfurtransferase [Microbacterium sp. AG238]WJM16424.1 rhodanese-like domain-containing protein [Microbacterium arborescens]